MLDEYVSRVVGWLHLAGINSLDEVESDCVALVAGVNTETCSRSAISSKANEIKSILSLLLASIFSEVNRSGC